MLSSPRSRVIASLSQEITLLGTIAQVEALAARRAMEFALEMGIIQAIVEGDSEIIFKDLINFEPSLGLHSHLIEDIKLLASHFSCINFSHVRCQGNVVHTLARRAMLSLILLVWMENVPRDISNVVQAELACLI